MEYLQLLQRVAAVSGTVVVSLLAVAVLGSMAQAAAMPSETPSGYRREAEEATDWIQAHFWDGGALRYRPSFPIVPNELPYDFMWGNGVQFSVLAAAANENPDKYRPMLYDFTEGLGNYWDPAAPVPGYEAYCAGPGSPDKYYDDNAWMVLGFMEAYQNSNDKRFLQMARDTQRFVLSGWDDTLGGGIYWKLDHKTKNTCSNAPTAAAALRLQQVAGDPDQGVWARKIRDWTNAKLQDPKDGLYWDCVERSGKVEKTKWTYNTALMIRTDLLLYQLHQTVPNFQEAQRMADAGVAAWTDPATGSLHKTEKPTRFTHLFCEALLRLYDATEELKYLNAVRREASFGLQYARDPKGGYWNDWVTKPHKPDETKTLIENASAARLFWLLAPYPDVAELIASGREAAKHGDDGQAENLLRQAVESDHNAVESRFYLWEVLDRERKRRDAAAEHAALAALARNPAFEQRLKAAGWKP